MEEGEVKSTIVLFGEEIDFVKYDQPGSVRT
jgi:hypothetical protein